MQINKDKNHRCAVCVEVPEKVSAGNISHDVLNGRERPINVGRIMHREEDTSHELKGKEESC